MTAITRGTDWELNPSEKRKADYSQMSLAGEFFVVPSSGWKNFSCWQIIKCSFSPNT